MVAAAVTRIESQPGNDQKRMPLACVDGNPTAGTGFAITTQLLRRSRCVHSPDRMQDIGDGPRTIITRIEKVLVASPIPIRFTYQIVSCRDGGSYYCWSAAGRHSISVFESRSAARNIMVCIGRCTNTAAKETEKTGEQKSRTRKHRADIATNPKNVSTKKTGGFHFTGLYLFAGARPPARKDLRLKAFSFLCGCARRVPPGPGPDRVRGRDRNRAGQSCIRCSGSSERCP
jgi:hypothetical protein